MNREEATQAVQEAIAGLRSEYCDPRISFDFHIEEDDSRFFTACFKAIIEVGIIPGVKTPTEQPISYCFRLPKDLSRLPDIMATALREFQAAIPFPRSPLLPLPSIDWVSNLSAGCIVDVPAERHFVENGLQFVDEQETFFHHLTRQVSEGVSEDLISCKNYNHTSADINPCALHPGRENGCKQCPDYAPHPLSDIFDFSCTQSIALESYQYTVCPISTNRAARRLFAEMVRRFLQKHSNLSPRYLYFVGYRQRYYDAIAYLGVDCLPFFDIDDPLMDGIRLFYVEN